MDSPKTFFSDIDPTNPVVSAALMNGFQGALRIALKALVEAKGGPGPWLDALEEDAAKNALGLVAEGLTAGKEAEFEKIKHASEQVVRVYFAMAREGRI